MHTLCILCHIIYPWRYDTFIYKSVVTVLTHPECVFSAILAREISPLLLNKDVILLVMHISKYNYPSTPITSDLTYLLSDCMQPCYESDYKPDPSQNIPTMFSSRANVVSTHCIFCIYLLLQLFLHNQTILHR